MKNLIVERDGEIKRLILNRPDKRNALCMSLAEDLLEQIQISEGDGTRLLVLTGNGSSFCAGFDFENYTNKSDGDLLLHFVRIEQMLQALAYASFDTLAFIHGHTVGAGADLAVACKHRFATSNTKVMFPGARFGLILGTRRLAQCIGGQQAINLVGGPVIDADEAIRIRLIDGILVDECVAYESKLMGLIQAVPRITRSQILQAGRADTRAVDMNDLVNSASAINMRQQLKAYLEKAAANAKK